MRLNLSQLVADEQCLILTRLVLVNVQGLTIRVTHGTVGWAAFSFPSPRPSPQGRGRIVRRLSAMPAMECAKPVCAKFMPAVGSSLSPRERARVRGNQTSTANGCRLSKGLLSKRGAGPGRRIG